MTFVTEWRDGFAAYMAGLDRNKCPHQIGCKRAAWIDGYNWARDHDDV